MVREPVGVVGCITPWNYPLHQVVCKVAPALAAGCTVVLKPSEVAPLSAFMLAEIIHEARLPAGVFNLVSGDGPTVGEAIASHPKVDMVSFTGSTRAGRRVAELAAKTVKRVALELGGKSPNMILDDADLEKPPCAAGVTKLLPELGPDLFGVDAHARAAKPHDEAAQIAKDAAEKFQPGPAMSDDPARPAGLRHSARARARLHQERDRGGRNARHRRRRAAGRPREGLLRAPDRVLKREERHDDRAGRDLRPGVVHHPVRHEEDAVRIANDTIYGLAGGVWSTDPERAKRVARRIRTGQVDINGGNFNPSRRSAATSSPAAAASSESSASRSTSRSNRCSSELSALRPRSAARRAARCDSADSGSDGRAGRAS